jgi:nucleotide-binding universal stress UspA family protein
MQTLVVPLDGSEFAERALPVASRLARRLDGEVIAMTSRWDGRLDTPDEYLRSIAKWTTDVETTLVHDKDAVDAIEFVAHDGPDRTVCMTSHGRGGLRWAVLGSVAEAVVRRVPQPTLLVGRHCDPQRVGANDVVVCWDGSDAANALLAPVAAWATALELNVHLVYVAHPLDVDSIEHPDALFANAVGKLEADGLTVSARVLRGNYPAGMIADYASSHRAALLAAATNGRTGVARVALGSTTMGLVGSAPCPVLVAHPPR